MLSLCMLAAHLAACAAMSAIRTLRAPPPEFGWAFGFWVTFSVYAVLLAPVTIVLRMRPVRTWLSWTFWLLAAIALTTLIDRWDGMGLLVSFPLLAVGCALILRVPRQRPARAPT